MGKGVTYDSEVKQGKDLIDAGFKAGITHFVYSSVDRGGKEASDEEPTPFPAFASKFAIEQYLFEKQKAQPGISYTVIRPTGFMDNLQPNFFGQVLGSIMALKNQTAPYQMIACSDIGWFVAQSFVNYQDEVYRNTSLSLAGDELTWDQMDKVFREVTGQGHPQTWGILVRLLLTLSKEMDALVSCRVLPKLGRRLYQIQASLTPKRHFLSCAIDVMERYASKYQGMQKDSSWIEGFQDLVGDGKCLEEGLALFQGRGYPRNRGR